MLLQSVKELASDPEGRELIPRLRDSYRFPVDTHVYTPDLRLVARQNANEMIPQESLKIDFYYKLLCEALQDIDRMAH